MFQPKHTRPTQREFGEIAVPVVSGHRASLRVIEPETREEALSKARWLLEQFRKSCRQKEKNRLAKPRRSNSRQILKPKYKVVVLDDDETTLRATEEAISHWFEDVEVLSFQDPAEAWHEITEKAPDAFVTDFYHGDPSAEIMIRMLNEKEASFPILVISGGAEAEQAQRSAGPLQRVSFLKKPWSHEQFCRELSKCFKTRQQPNHYSKMTPEEIIRRQRLHKAKVLRALRNQGPVSYEEALAQVQRSLATNRTVPKKSTSISVSTKSA
jgi:FixJ family two-component response regulator